jgi:hypothetical protein
MLRDNSGLSTVVAQIFAWDKDLKWPGNEPATRSPANDAQALDARVLPLCASQRSRAQNNSGHERQSSWPVVSVFL